MNHPTLHAIAHIHTDFATKFGIPRQSGLVKNRGVIVFEPDYRSPDALREIDGFSHLWLIWQFSGNVEQGWSPTVRPPRLGGNVRVGVFASRSPFRPNSLGLSCVQLERVEWETPHGPVLHVLGADIRDGTPIFDIKPYVPYADSYPDARGGFADTPVEETLTVTISPELVAHIPANLREPLRGVLAHDPRPRYQNDPTRVYGLTYGSVDVRFTVEGTALTVVDVTPILK